VVAVQAVAVQAEPFQNQQPLPCSDWDWQPSESRVGAKADYAYL